MARPKTKVVADDDLTIPPHLRRERTPETADVVRKLLRSEERREWRMPDRSNDMARTESSRPQLEVEDPALPVEMSLTTAEGKKEIRNFGCAQEFIDWYDPKLHELEGSISDSSSTMVAVREKPRPRVAKAKGDPRMKDVNKAEGPIPQPEKASAPKKAVGRSAVIKKGPRAAGNKPRTTPPKRSGGGGFVKHGVRVGGREYRSAWDAFQQLNLGNASECVKFRNKLKAAKDGKLEFVKGGKKYLFETFEVRS